MNSARHTTDLKRFVTFKLSRLQSKLNAQAIRVLRQHSELSLTEWRIIGMTAVHEELTLSVLARETELDKGQLSRAVTSLVKKRLVRSRVNDADQRQNFLTLTETGQELHDRMLPVMQARQTKLTQEISEEEMVILDDILDRLERASENTGS